MADVTADTMTTASTTSEDSIRKPFVEFAEQNGDYYADTFLKIQKNELPSGHMNFSAMVGSFVWAALRGNWLLFVIGFVVDLVTMVNLALVYKYSKAAVENADKDFLVARYEGWTTTHMIGAVVVFVLGRLLFGWLADRMYSSQYERWRINRKINSGVDTKRLIFAGLIVLQIGRAHV